MNDVSIIGPGQTEVKEMWGTSIRHLAWYAIEAALDDAHVSSVDALFVGNMAAGQLSNQMHLGALVADFAGLRGIEAVTVEAADASGGAALRQAVLAVKSGLVETALVVGVEKMTDQVGSPVRPFSPAPSTPITKRSMTHRGWHGGAADAPLPARIWPDGGRFCHFSVNAHANGAANPLAMYRNRLKADRFASAPPVATPVTLFDAAPSGDGAAAVIITRHERAQDMVPQPIRIVGSALATDTLALHDRKNMLHLRAAELSAKAMAAAASATTTLICLSCTIRLP
ncbi:MAG: beta-ketoacyl synthase N-terminal-like domain-containing protein [Chloroflexota bacterium]